MATADARNKTLTYVNRMWELFESDTLQGQTLRDMLCDVMDMAASGWEEDKQRTIKVWGECDRETERTQA